MKVFSQSFQQLEQALSTATLKQKVIANNIANVDTPNYKSKQVSFQTVLNDTLGNQSFQSYKTNPSHLPFSNESSHFNPKIHINSQTKYTPNGNNVDMDYEMAELAKNQLWYNALTDRMNGKFNSLRTVINEGR